MAELLKKSWIDDSKLPLDARRDRMFRRVRRGFKRTGRPAPRVLQIFGWEAKEAKQVGNPFIMREDHFKEKAPSGASKLVCLGDVWAEGKALKEVNKWAENKMDIRRLKALLRGESAPTVEELGSVHITIANSKDAQVQQCLCAILVNAIKSRKEGLMEAADACLDTLLELGMEDFRDSLQ